MIVMQKGELDLFQNLALHLIATSVIVPDRKDHISLCPFRVSVCLRLRVIILSEESL